MGGLVWVEARLEPRTAPVAAVRGQAVHAIASEGSEARLRTRLDALRQRYRIELPAGAAGTAGATAKGNLS